MSRKHPQAYKKYDDDDKGKKLLPTKTLKRKYVADPNQQKITDFTGSGLVMNDCVDLAVHRGLSFKTFDRPEMRNLTKFAKLGSGDNTKKLVNAENVKAAISERAAEGRSLTADFATCERRSFFGKLAFA